MASPAIAAPGPEGLVERVQTLTTRLDAIDDPAARETAQELIGAIWTYTARAWSGSSRLSPIPRRPGPAIRERLTSDGVVGSLLLIHGLYPIGLEARVTDALEKVRPYMASHGGNVELLEPRGRYRRLAAAGHLQRLFRVLRHARARDQARAR